MTLEQVRDALKMINKHYPEITRDIADLVMLAEAIDAHLTRQSEGVSDEVMECATDRIIEAYIQLEPSDAEIAGVAINCKETRSFARELARAALTAVLHNRPAHEKAEPVVEILGWNNNASPRLRYFVKIDHLPAGTKLYTAPPAERVRVPDMEQERALAFRAGAEWADENQVRLSARLPAEPRALVIAKASNKYAVTRSAEPEANS